MSDTRFKEDEFVRCPYYCKESSTDIRCAGLLGMHTTHDFFNKKAKEEYKKDFCCSLYMSCMVYQMLEEEQR